jgi:flavorubredoxin
MSAAISDHRRRQDDAREHAVKNAVVIYQSLTGNTRRAGDRIAAELNGAGVSTVACSTIDIDYTALAAADIVIVGTWTDGLILFGQRPGQASHLRAMPVIDGKRAAVFCTYAIDTGKTLQKLQTIVEGRGGEVIGGLAIKRNKIDEGAARFADRLLAAPAPTITPTIAEPAVPAG